MYGSCTLSAVFSNEDSDLMAAGVIALFPASDADWY
jgi:hypothetical protein